MPQPDPARPARRRVRDRHGRNHPTASSTNRTGPRSTSGPRSTLGPPRVVPMTGPQYEQAVRAWAALIASWWTDNPPDTT
jgi:hypothetical protein